MAIFTEYLVELIAKQVDENELVVWYDQQQAYGSAVAKQHLEPDLNDGSVLNIAPHHELVPRKEAKHYWEELTAVKFEWSSIGKQLRVKGLVKC